MEGRLTIWLLNPYGQIPGEGWRDYRFTLAARALAARGHGVTWWTAAFDHHTKRTRGAPPHDSFAIELVDTPPYSRNVSLARLRFERVFAGNVLRLGRSRARPDVIIAADPPQFCGTAGRKLAKHHRVPLVIDCLDLWPELFVSAAPRLLRPLAYAAVQPLRAMRRRNVRASALTIAVAETYRRVLAEAGAKRAITIPIGVDVDAFRVERIRHDRFTLVYAGSLGEHYDLDTLLDAVASLDVDLLIAGQGPAEPRLHARNLTNVRFLGVVPPSDLPALYARCDVGVATYAAGSTVAMPLKCFDYLAAGLPIISSLDGGYVAGDAASLRDAISLVRSRVARASSLRPDGNVTESAGRESGWTSPPDGEIDAKILYARYVDEVEAVAR